MAARYIIVLDRYTDDQDYAYGSMGDNSGHNGTAQKAIEQVASELQEAMEQTGQPAGFFQVIDRMLVSDNQAVTLVQDSDAIMRDVQSAWDREGGLCHNGNPGAPYPKPIPRERLSIVPDVDEDGIIDNPWQVLVKLDDGSTICPGVGPVDLEFAVKVVEQELLVGDTADETTIEVLKPKVKST